MNSLPDDLFQSLKGFKVDFAGRRVKALPYLVFKVQVRELHQS